MQKEKYTIAILALILFSTLCCMAQDTLYIIPDNGEVARYPTNEIDSICFTKSQSSKTLTDIDGNRYRTVKIGEQTWMAENLRVTRYANGMPILYLATADEWHYKEKDFDMPLAHTEEPDTVKAFCFYNNDFFIAKKLYGALYSYAAVVNGNDSSNNVQGVCPEGWHVPGDDEWKILEKHLGMSQSEADSLGWRGSKQGDLLKTTHAWDEDGSGVNNYGFSALPGGGRNYHYYGRFTGLGSECIWWSSTKSHDGYSWIRSLYFNYSSFHRGFSNMGEGHSVRCVKNKTD